MSSYVWGIFNYFTLPPMGIDLHNASGDDCQFYPFQHNKGIFTIDSMLWGVGEELFAPTLNTIKDEIFIEKDKNETNLVALILEKYITNIDAPNEIKLQSIPEKIIKQFLFYYERIGIDIVDILGVSGLANIGYSKSQTKKISKKKIKINKFGLLDEYSHAEALAKIASSAASEHAPFIPIEIWKRK